MSKIKLPEELNYLKRKAFRRNRRKETSLKNKSHMKKHMYNYYTVDSKNVNKTEIRVIPEHIYTPTVTHFGTKVNPITGKSEVVMYRTEGEPVLVSERKYKAVIDCKEIACKPYVVRADLGRHYTWHKHISNKSVRRYTGIISNGSMYKKIYDLAWNAD